MSSQVKVHIMQKSFNLSTTVLFHHMLPLLLTVFLALQWLKCKNVTLSRVSANKVQWETTNINEVY